LAKSHIDVGVDLLQSPPQLLDLIRSVLNPAGQIAHLSLDPVQAKFGVDRRIVARSTRSNGGAAAAVDLPLQHAEISFQSLEPVLHHPILRARRVDRQGYSDKHQQQGNLTGMRQGRAPEHPKASWIRPRAGG
jgi:hypothetical protein